MAIEETDTPTGTVGAQDDTPSGTDAGSSFSVDDFRLRLDLPLFHRDPGMVAVHVPELRELTWEHVIRPTEALPGADIEAIGADAKRNRGEKCIDRGEIGAGKPWSAEFRQPLLEQLADPRNIGLQRVRHRLRLHAHPDIHRAIVSQRRKAAVHFAGCALRPAARVRIVRPHAGVGHIQLRTDRDWVNDIARFVLAYRRVASQLHAPPQGVSR